LIREEKSEHGLDYLEKALEVDKHQLILEICSGLEESDLDHVKDHPRLQSIVEAYRQEKQEEDSLEAAGTLLLSASRYGEAEQAFSEVLKINPENETSLYKMACIMAIKARHGGSAEKDEVLRLLGELIRKNDGWKENVRADSFFSALVSDERFDQLIKAKEANFISSTILK